MMRSKTTLSLSACMPNEACPQPFSRMCTCRICCDEPQPCQSPCDSVLHVHIQDVATLLRQRLGARAARAPKRTLPDWLIWIGSWVSPTMAALWPTLGLVRHATGEKATCVFHSPACAGPWRCCCRMVTRI